LKRKETLELEQALNDVIIDRHRNSSFGYYGCEEITIGFANNGHGNEIVDFMTMNSKGIIRCYEIKVTMADLKSKAKKSWYGHYNYLVIGDELYKQIEEVKLLIPNEIGIIYGVELKSIRKPKLKNIHVKTETMLKESMVRSIYHKMNKYKDTKDIEKYKKMNNSLNRAKREKNKINKEFKELYNIVRMYERKNNICLYKK
jgi:hypothetical protein